MSEKRIAVARAARRFPRLIEMRRTGAIHLSDLRIVLPHLTDENAEALLEEARGKTKREIEGMIASHAPRPAVPESIRKVPAPACVAPAPSPAAASPSDCGPLFRSPDPPSPKPVVVAPLAQDLYYVQLTASRELQGYAPATVALKVRVAAEFGHWLGRRGLAVGDLDEQCVTEFLRRHRGPPPHGRGDASTLRDQLQEVRSAGLAPPPPARVDGTTIGRTVREFDRYLSVDRGLSVATRINYLPIVRSFLMERFDDGEAHLDALGPRDASDFLVRHVRAVHPKRAGLMVAALRGFLRWVHLRGDVATDLAATVPRSPSGASLRCRSRSRRETSSVSCATADEAPRPVCATTRS